MNETTSGPGIPPGAPSENPAGYPPPGYQPPPPAQDLDRLRRSLGDRYIAGVAGGIGRHFGIDPTIIRVLLAVLAFFGGAGVLIYGVCWLFVPEDGQDRATVHVSAEPRRLVLLAAVGIGFLLAVGDAFSGFNAGWPIATLAVVIAIVLVAKDRKDDRAQATPPPAGADPAGSYAQYGQDYAQQWTQYATTTAEDAVQHAMGTVPPPPPPPPTWQPPAYPPRAKRTGVVWFWPTLALIAIALGTIGVLDSGNDIDPGVYPATAVAITGVMLLIGSFVGRPGGLVLIGIVSTVALSISTVVGGFNFNGQDLELAPRTAAAVEPSYEIHNGRIELDLTRLSDPQELAGRTIELTLGAGEIHVIVPRSLNLHIDAEFDFAGGIKVPGYDGGGIQDSVERTIVGAPATDEPALGLDIESTVGQITVEQR